MIRTLLVVSVGALAGIAAGAGLLLATRTVLRWQSAPKVFEVEHWVIYLGLIVSAGFGAVCGALAALARAVSDRGPSGR
jgi:hypothetical protein